MSPVTVRQSLKRYYKNSRQSFAEPGRLFLCLTIASDGVSETERGQHEADNSD